MNENPILITNGTGKTGSRVAERLRAAGRPVRIGSRKGDPAFDWEDRATWAPALEGTSAAYVSYFPDLAVEGAPEAIAAFAQDARAAGVDRLVLLSGRGEEEAQRAEAELQASGADWTIVRCSWFAQSFSEGLFRELIAAGELALPRHIHDIPEPFVDVGDIADVAAAALTEAGHVGRLYELTGPDLLTFPAAIDVIARAAGRPVDYVSIELQQFAQSVPPEFAGFLTYLFTEVLDGRNAHLADGVREALGRPARSFQEYAREAAASGAWT